MKKIKKEHKIMITAVLIIAIFTISVISANQGDIILANASIGNNKTIAWGIKRADNHEQPDVGESNKKMLEENGGICLGKKDSKNIYLTFDAGYEAGYTEKILETLNQNGVTATFFITSHYLNTASDLVEKMIQQGHVIGNHTVNHKSMPSITDEEIEKEVMQLHQAIHEKFNYEMKYIRPPKGEFNERTLQKCEKLGYKTVMWSFAYCDWDEKKQPSIEEGKKKIIENLHPGEIMLLHSNSKTNSEILDTIIKETKNQGYEFKSLEQFE